MARLGSEHLADMSDEGSKVRERRERLGMDKKAFAEAAGINRNTLTAIEAGESFNRTTLAKIERTLDALEEEAGIHAPPRREEPEQQFIELRADGVRGSDFEIKSIVAKGSPSDPKALAAAVAALIEQVRHGGGNETDTLHD